MKKIHFLVLTCSFLLFITSCKKDINSGTGGRTTPRAATASSFKVVGYLPSWAGSVSSVQFSKLTHVLYAFLIPTSSGGYQAVDDASKLSSMVTAAHAAGTKAMISVGGGGGGGGFAGIVASSANRTTFVNNMLSFCNQYNLDGVDIDWEYPNTGTQADNFNTLMAQLATALHNVGKQLSIAVIGEDDGGSIESGIFSSVDFVTIMAYDDNNFLHSTYELGTQCLAYWLGRGLPASKAVLGVPFYGHDSSQDPNSDAAEVEYNVILADGADPNQDVYGTFGYNGLRTMKSKTSYAMANAGGVGIWDLSGDATGSSSLLSAINSVVTAGGVLSTGAPVGTTITLKGNNGLYVSSKGGQSPMICNVSTLGGWEEFTLIDAGHGKVALQNSGFYVSDEDGENPINCNRTSYSTWEEFDWIVAADGNVTLRGTNSLFISSENGAGTMTCNRPVAQGWEEFGINKNASAQP